VIALTVTSVPLLGSARESEVTAALRSGGLWLDLGAAVLRVNGEAPALAGQLQATYRCHPLRTLGQWADVHVRIERPRSMRRWLRPQVVFSSDGRTPFEPFPADTALPLLEWGTNWLIGQRLNHLLLLHAGVVEKDGKALLLPALPGSGKSTLTAALSLSGWRLLSDEFGAFDPSARIFHAVLKPVALKNASIDVIRRFSASARLGPEFPKTRKGTVAHLAADEDTVRRRQETAQPGAIVLPRWQAGSATRLESLAPQSVFGALAFNAFNYRVLGAAGFDAVLHLSRCCAAYQLIYSDLTDAISRVEELWAKLR
jgi:HprK-related kinase A